MSRVPLPPSSGRAPARTAAATSTHVHPRVPERAQDHWPLERILPLMTSNPARLLQLRGRGVVSLGASADLLVLTHETLKLRYVWAKGSLVKTPAWVQGGCFEKGSRIRQRAAFQEPAGQVAGHEEAGGPPGAQACCH